MKVEYTINLKIKAAFECDNIEDIKSNVEFAEAVAQLVCDEVATAEGVASYEIYDSIINVN